MEEHVTAELTKKEPSKFHQTMLEDCRALVAMSRRKMKEYYAQWDRNDETYRAIQRPDKADKEAREKGEPEKMVVPITYSQIQTFVAFCYTLYTQRERMFETVGFSPEDDEPAKIAESLVARDLNHNIFEAKLKQFLTDIARFNMGVMKVTWVTEKQRVRVATQLPATEFLGATVQGGVVESIEEKVKYQGNRIENISPYRFFPDVRLPLTRFQEGEFVASEETYSFARLRQWEHEGVIAGLEHVKPIGKEHMAERGYRFDNDFDPASSMEPGAGIRGDGQVKKTVLITELQRLIVPADYEIEGKPLGPEKYPVKYVIWIANDNRIVKCEPMNYIHDQFTYVVAPYDHDNNVLIGLSLADCIDMLQSVITWFINSRITSVRKVISNFLVVDPAGINMDDLTNRRPVIRLRASAAGGVDRFIKQLDVSDVTTGHIQDVKFLHELIQVVTGINDSLLGQYQQGRRPATEHRNVTSGAASRLKTIASVIFRVALEPMARQMLDNLRDGLDEETFVRVLGEQAQSAPQFIQVTREQLVGNFDFEVFDGTLPTERHFSAQALMELVTAFMSNPQAAVALGFDIKKLLLEALAMRGVKNPSRFQLSPEQIAASQISLQTGEQPTTGAANGEQTGNGDVARRPGATASRV